MNSLIMHSINFDANEKNQKFFEIINSANYIPKLIFEIRSIFLPYSFFDLK